MPDYKLLYLTLLDGVEKAIILLTETQKACEEIYIDTDETADKWIKSDVFEKYGIVPCFRKNNNPYTRD